MIDSKEIFLTKNQESETSITAETTTTITAIVYLVSIFIVFTAVVLCWPKWMYLTKKTFLQRIYYGITPSLTYFQTKAIFENMFYCIFGVMVVLLISTGYQIPLGPVFLLSGEDNDGVNDFFEDALKILIESILLITANSAAIFVCTGLLLPSIKSFRKSRRLDFGGSWMETYMKLNPLALALAIALLSIFAEELFFRILANSVLLNNPLIMSLASGSIIPAALIAATISTLFFILQQAVMLNNKTQILAIGISSFWIGIINSTAFVLGASFYSILLSHYLFVIIMIISLRSGKQQSVKKFL